MFMKNRVLDHKVSDITAEEIETHSQVVIDQKLVSIH